MSKLTPKQLASWAAEAAQKNQDFHIEFDSSKVEAVWTFETHERRQVRSIADPDRLAEYCEDHRIDNRDRRLDPRA